MEQNRLTPRQALNKAFRKVKPNRSEIECFKENMLRLNRTIVESPIDQLVYELYGLTEEEIRIVEGEFKKYDN